jgi:hypothetical protein
VSVPQERVRIALELFDLATSMMRQRLRRERPGATEAELDALLEAWLRRRPGAERGDAPGRLVSWPRGRA